MALLGLLLNLQSQAQNGKWIFRLGAVGTGTSDKGIWTFNEASGLGTQEFEFSNSWGAALDVDYLITPRWTVGTHLAFSSTSFGINFNSNNGQVRDRTSFNPLMAEMKYRFRPDMNFRPYLGVTGGVLFTKDFILEIGGQEQEFEFANAGIYGVVFGFDWAVGGKGLAINMLIRAVTFEYTLQENDLSDRQTLLDQHWWQNFNHIQLGISKHW